MMLTLREADLLACLFVRVSIRLFTSQDQGFSPFVLYGFLRDGTRRRCPAFGKEAPWIARETYLATDQIKIKATKLCVSASVCYGRRVRTIEGKLPGRSKPLLSPFRYPGGKSWLRPIVQQWLSKPVRQLVEPFAGGEIGRASCRERVCLAV